MSNLRLSAVLVAVLIEMNKRLYRVWFGYWPSRATCARCGVTAGLYGRGVCGPCFDRISDAQVPNNQ